MFQNLMTNKAYGIGAVIIIIIGAVFVTSFFVKKCVHSEIGHIRRKERKLEKKRQQEIMRSEMKRQRDIEQQQQQSMYDGGMDQDIDSYMDPMGNNPMGSGPVGVGGFRDDLQENINMREMVDRGCSTGSCRM